MVEPISLFFAAIVWYEIIVIGIISVLMVGFLWEEHAIVPFIGLIAILFYDWGTHGAFVQVGSILDVWVFLLVYISFGLFWSFFKWGRLIKKFIKDYDSEEDVRYRLSNFSNDRIAYWVLWWPFSIAGFVFDDAIQWVIEHFRGVYNMITDKLISSAISSNSIKEAKPYVEDEDGSDMDNYFNKKNRR